MEIEFLLILAMSGTAFFAGFILGTIRLGRYMQKELLGHTRLNYSPQKMIDEIKNKLGGQ